jgi:serine/threonine-protein kinase
MIGRGVNPVYQAWDPRIERHVAIKTVPIADPEDGEAQDRLARFRREAQVAGDFKHANIVTVHDYSETAEVAYLVMELVEGRPLDRILRERGRLPLEQAINLTLDLLSALEFTHRRGIVHRDIKPANILVTNDWQLKLTDFGIAHTESSDLTEHGMLLGTLSYMSPEQHTGEQVDARTDIFSAAVLLFEMLAGKRPFEDPPSVERIRPLAGLVEDVPPATLNALDAILAKALAKRPDDRFASADAFATALRQVLEMPADAAALDDMLQTIATKPKRRRRLPLTAALAALAALAVLAPAGLRELSSPPSSEAEQASRLAQETAIARLVATAPCTWLSVTAGTGSTPTVLRGFANPAGASQIQAEVQAVAPGVPLAWQIEQIDGPYCPVFEMLRDAGLATQSQLSLAVPGGRTQFRQGDILLLNVAMPDYPARLTLDYYAHGGGVFHMVPAPLNPDRVWPAGASATLGEPRADFPGWVVQPPFGRDLLVAITSAVPLLPQTETETTTDYLLRLRDAIGAARASMQAVAATVLAIDTVPRP